MPETPPAEGGIFATVARVIQLLRDTAANRVELFAVELKEERLRLFDALMLMAVVAVCGLMALVTLTVTVVVIFWDSYRLLALAVITVLYAAGGAGAFFKLRSQLRHWRSFEATLGEIKKDSECFKKTS